MRSLVGACAVCVCLGFAATAVSQVNDARTPASAPLDALPETPPPELPEIDDPMLTPVAPPTRVVASWREALALVRARSTSIAIAQTQIDQAQGRARQSLAGALPSLSASGGFRRALLFGDGAGANTDQRLPDPATVWNAGLSLNQPLLDTRAWYDIGTSKSAEHAAVMRAQDAERIALATLADSIVSVITAERLAEVSRVSLRSNLSALDLTQRRARLGAASQVDVLRAEQEVVSNRADVVQADESVRRARETLGSALGYAQDWGVTPDIKVDTLAADAAALCAPVGTPDERSDVRAAALDVEVAERSAKSSNYGYAPTLDLVSDVLYTTQEPTNNGRPVQWSIGAVLSVPIYDGGRLSAEHRINIATAHAARQQLTEASRQANLQATQAQRGVVVAVLNFDVSKNARAIAQESARLSRVAFLHGTGTSFDLVESARRLRLAEIDLTIKEFEVVRARLTALLALANCSI